MGVERRRAQRALRSATAALLVTAALLGALKPARAQSGAPSATAADQQSAAAPSVELSWSGPGPEFDCLGAERLVRAVNDFLGRAAFSAGPAELTLRVRVERRADRGWRALLQIIDLSGAGLGERELVSDSTLCSSLDEPLKLAVALMVDSELVASAEPEPAPAVEPDEPLDPQPAKEAPSAPWTLSADASVLIETGLLPAASPGVELGLELSPAPWLSLRGSGVGFLPASAELEGSAQAKMSLTFATLAFCPSTALGAHFRLLGCVGVSGGTLFAETSALERARSTKRRIFAASFGVRAVARLSRRWAFLAQIGGILPYRPERFVYEVSGQRSEFFRMSTPALVAGMGGSIMF